MNILQRKKGTQQRQDLQRVQELYQELVSKTPKCVGTYMLDKTIGQGSFGKIKLALHALTGHQVALKVIDKTHAHAVVREVEHWRRLNHPHIVRLYELLTTETKIYLAMEYASRGDLLLWVNKVGRPTLGDTRKWFRQTADAVAYLHRRNLVHRDLKLENILLDDQLDVKLIDFGFTREFDQRRMLESYCGSMAYAAPEMISGQRYSGPEADIWSLGVILYTLLCGRLPFDEDDPVQTNRKIVLGEYTIPNEIDPEAANLIKAMLQVRAKDRVDIDRILVHPWLFRAATSEADDETKPESLPKSPPPQSPSPYANGYGSGSGGRSLDQLSSSPMSLVQSFAQSMPHIRSTPPRKGSAPLIQSDHLNVALNASNANSNSARSSTDSLEEGELMAMLSRVGINTKAMERSVRRDACDALTALYYILGTRLRRRNSALSIAASSVKTAPQLRSTSRHDDQLANQPLITRFNKSNPEDLSTIESTPMSMSPPPQPLHGMDNALRKMSLPWLSFTSSSSSSTNNQHSHSQHNNSAMAVATAGNGQMTASNGGGGNGNGAASNDGADAPTTLREKERRSRSPNRLSTLFRDLRRRGTGSSSKERSPERHRWQQWSSDPTLTQRAREMAQGAPPMPSLNGGPLKPSGVPSIHVRHSSKDYSSSGQNVHNIAKDPRSRSIGDLRGVAEEHRRAQAASDYPMPMMPKGIKGVGAATGLTRSESERSTKRSSTKITSGATGNGIASPLVAGHGESMNMTTPSIDDANGATSSLTSGRGEAMNMTAPSIDGVNGTEHSIESPTVVSTGLPESITSPIAIATVPLPSWKLAGSPTRSLQHPFSTTTMVTRRNLLNVVRSVSASEEAANDIQEADEEGGGGSVDGGNGGDLDATSSATRSTMRPKAAPALAMMIEEEEEEE